MKRFVMDSVFSAVGIAVMFVAWLALLAFLVWRMNHEERVLASEFGAEWEEYAQRTPWRLLPGVY